MCVRAMETIYKAEEMKRKCIYIWMYSSYCLYLHDSVTWAKAAHFISGFTFHPKMFHSLRGRTEPEPAKF